MPAPSSKRVEVDLYLKANDDLKNLQSALEGFSTNLSNVGGGGGVGSGRGVVIDPSSTTAGMVAARDKIRAATGAPPPGAPGSGILGDIMGAPRAMVSKTLQGFNPRSNAFNPSQAIMEAAFLPQALSNTIGRFGGLASTIGTGGGFTQYGASQGLSAAGGLGSPAFMAGLHNVAAQYSQAYGIGQPGGTSMSSFFSALRNQNLGDIKQMNAGLSTLGWNGSLLNRMVGASSSNQLSAIDPQLRADLMNSTRYGTASISGLSTQLRSMATDARAAHMSVGQFSQSIQQVIESLGGQFGTPQSALTQAGRGASLATGLDPSIALSGVTQTTMFMSLAQHAGGPNPFLNTYGRAGGVQGAALASYAMVVRASGLGQTLDDARAFLRANGRDATLNALWKSYEFARQLWPANMTPPMFLQIIQRGTAGVQAGFNLSHDVAALGKNVSEAQLSQITHEGITALGGGAKAQSDIQHAIATGGSRHTIARRIEGLVARANQRQTADRSQGKFTISLDRAAAQALNIQPADSNTRNATTKMNGGTAIVYNTPRFTK